MGTLSSIFTNTRIKLRETQVEFFSNDELISLSNDLFESFYSSLREYECKHVVGYTEISIVDGTVAYTISGKHSLLPEMILQESGERVPIYNPLKPDTFSFIETDTGIEFYNLENTDKVIIYYWKDFTEFTDVADETPLDGFWDGALQDSLVLQCKAIREHEVNDAAYFANRKVNEALISSINKYGTLHRRLKGTLNV